MTIKILSNITVVWMEYDDLDNLINKHFPGAGCEYHCLYDNEWGNYQDHWYHVEGLKPRDLEPDSYWNKYSVRDIIAYANGGTKAPSVNDMLSYLANVEQVIEHGYYLVHVYW